ncbi:Crp/Fnr family transcriptional regulator [Ruficoccus sp. ZRK36]|uniref:Crp/Fnr family transcriptional regulator n=1 Tax=Ruficoccus sp. ZRK36 TaxID=2866311 RepID=UPI001C73021B|nr:Crp/Fnr family transcriptional regulator [Ruficoccus sp. ZRK36]QYY35000.1 Crp/Fnr family transcriptional regulator [Ruficoccus sp. ZRK36]
MSEYEAIISQCSLFQGLGEQDISSLAGICSEKKVARGELIFVEGTPAQGFYLVAQGQVKIFKSNAEGKEIILHVCGPVESFAEVPVFHGAPYPASASATQTSRLLYFPRAELAETISRHPTLSLNMLANLAQKLRRFTKQIESLALKEVPARLASHLIYLTENQKHPERVTLRLPKGQLANLLGTSPETLSRVFARLTEAGIIQMNGKDISILDRDELIRLAD